MVGRQESHDIGAVFSSSVNNSRIVASTRSSRRSTRVPAALDSAGSGNCPTPQDRRAPDRPQADTRAPRLHHCWPRHRATHAITVIASEHVLRGRIRRGEECGSTHNIEKLLRRTTEIDDPSHIRDENTLAQWIASLQEHLVKWKQDLLERSNDVHLEKVLANLEKAVAQEFSGPRSWYGKVRALIAPTSKRQQVAVFEETDKDRLGTYSQGPGAVADAQRRFWANLFSNRKCDTPYP